MRHFFTFFTILSLNIVFCKFPSTIPTCSRHDPRINDCIANAILLLAPRLATGELGPGLTIPPLEPFVIPKLQFGDDNSLKVFLSNIQVRGASRLRVQKIRMNYDDLKLDLIFIIPRLQLRSKYRLSYYFLTGPVKSDGDYNASFEDSKIRASMKAHRYHRDGVEYARVEPITVKFTRGKVHHVRLTNLFGSGVISEVIHAAINNNPDFVFNYIYPQVNAHLSRLATEVATRIFEGNSLDEIFPR